jgi:hypothetical protein
LTLVELDTSARHLVNLYMICRMNKILCVKLVHHDDKNLLHRLLLAAGSA